MLNPLSTVQPPPPSAPSPVASAPPDCSLIDYPGRMAAMLFTAGCNFRCPFCHNALALAGPVRPGIPWKALDDALRRFRGNWVSAAVITGGEPTLHPGLPDLVRFLKARGFSVKLDTNGSRPEVLRDLLPSLDYVAMDIKCALADYPRLVGCPDPAPIAESVHLLVSSVADYEFRTTVLPSWHTTDTWPALADLLSGARRYILQPFLPRPEVLSPDLRDAPETPHAFLLKMQAALAPRLPVTLRAAF